MNSGGGGRGAWQLHDVWNQVVLVTCNTIQLALLNGDSATTWSYRVMVWLNAAHLVRLGCPEHHVWTETSLAFLASLFFRSSSCKTEAATEGNQWSQYNTFPNWFTPPLWKSDRLQKWSWPLWIDSSSLGLNIDQSGYCCDVIYQTRGKVFHSISKHREVVWENEGEPSLLFQPISRCLEIGRNTVSSVWFTI